MLQSILVGIFIGLSVSVPVGPLGILCIQRTLTKGRLHGFITGLGATTSDIIYAILVGFGMNYIINIIEAHRQFIQIGGSIIILFFGLYLFRKRINSHPHELRQSLSKNDLINDYLSALALCFSNPLIVFIFIGLFAQFHIFGNQFTLSENFIALISILGGAALWWSILTLIVGKLTKHFNIRGLTILNHITGTLLVITATIGIITAFL